MAFRDPHDALREELESAKQRLAQLEADNAALRAKHSPQVRRLAAVLSALLVLGAGGAWHLIMQNHGLTLTSRQCTDSVEGMRADLEDALAARAAAENAVLTAEAACSRREAAPHDDAAAPIPIE